MIYQNPPSNFASGGQKPFREKVSGLPKAFYYKKFLGVSGPFSKKVLTRRRQNLTVDSCLFNHHKSNIIVRFGKG